MASNAALFDLDGVLIDSRAQHMAAWAEWGRRYAPNAPPGYFERSFGLRNDGIIGALLPDISAEERDRLADEKEAMFRRLARGKLELLPGVSALLDALVAANVPCAIVTSTPRANLDMILASLDIRARFGALVAAEDTTRGKPDPEGYLLAARMLGATPAACTVLEDAPAGIAAAKAGGMRAVAVTTTWPARDLLAADLIVDRLDDPRVLRLIVASTRA